MKTPEHPLVKMILKTAAVIAALGTIVGAWVALGGDIPVLSGKLDDHKAEVQDVLQDSVVPLAQRAKVQIRQDWTDKRLRKAELEQKASSIEDPIIRNEIREQIKLYEESIASDEEEYQRLDKLSQNPPKLEK